MRSNSRSWWPSIAAWRRASPCLLRPSPGPSTFPVGRVDAALTSWPGVYRDDERRVVGFWGSAIAALEPEYRLRVDGKTSFAWCALDTLFIPAFLGKTVSVEASDPVTGEQVSLVVDRNGARDVK